MANCLVTKLKSTVSSDLDVLGNITWHLGYIKSDSILTILGVSYAENSEGGSLELINGYFTDSTGTDNLGTVKDNATYHGYFYIKSVDSAYETSLIISNKYDLTKLPINFATSSATNTAFSHASDNKLDLLKYSNKLTHFGANVNWNMSGDLSSLSNLTNLTTLVLNNNSNITGNLSSLANCINLNIFGVMWCPSITGDLVTDFLVPHVENGGSDSGSNLYVSNSGVTYSGNSALMTASKFIVSSTTNFRITSSNNNSIYDEWKKVDGVWTLIDSVTE